MTLEMVTSEEVQARLDSLAKPPKSLGLLERWGAVLARAQGTLQPVADPASVPDNAG